jgi:hypothetical protein
MSSAFHNPSNKKLEEDLFNRRQRNPIFCWWSFSVLLPLTNEELAKIEAEFPTNHWYWQQFKAQTFQVLKVSNTTKSSTINLQMDRFKK